MKKNALNDSGVRTLHILAAEKLAPEIFCSEKENGKFFGILYMRENGGKQQKTLRRQPIKTANSTKERNP